MFDQRPHFRISVGYTHIPRHCKNIIMLLFFYDCIGGTTIAPTGLRAIIIL